MAKLIVLHGTEPGPGIDFDLKNSIVIGRHRKADVVLSKMIVSRQHARVILEGGEWFIEDLDSNNGTFVNGEQITKKQLSAKDRIQIGRHVFSFEDSVAAGEDPYATRESPDFRDE